MKWQLPFSTQFTQVSLPSLFFSIKTLISPIRSVLFLNTPTSPLKSLALGGSNPTKLTQTLNWAAHPNPSPSIPIFTAYTTGPPTHRTSTASAPKPTSKCTLLLCFWNSFFKVDILFAAAGKRSHENFSSGSYGGVEEEEQSIQQLRFKAASPSFSSVSSRKKMKPSEPKIPIRKSSGPVEEERPLRLFLVHAETESQQNITLLI